jgi:hypothetical protein
MQRRHKFPYTARSSARVIRHAVSIDERRAKFRQDLISQDRPNRSNYYKRRRRKPALTTHTLDGLDGKDDGLLFGDKERGRSPSKPNGRRETLAVPGETRDYSQASTGTRNVGQAYTGVNSAATSLSNLSLDAIHYRGSYDSDDEEEQNIKEVWFAGCHAVRVSFFRGPLVTDSSIQTILPESTSQHQDKPERLRMDMNTCTC